jgi:hypothetical protein
VVYLAGIENSFLEKASERDRALYQLLSGVSPDILMSDTDSQETKMWKMSFSNAGGLEELSKLREIKPFRGLHYSSNMVLLIAAARIDKNSEQNNISTYLGTHSYKDLLVINKALSENYNETCQSNTRIDSLAKKLIIQEKLSEDDIAACLSEIKDLYDIFIVKLACATINSRFEERENLPSYRKLVSLGEVVFSKINLVAYVFVFILFAFLVFLVTPLITSFIENWDKWEPIAFLAETAIFLIILFLGWKVKTFKKWINTTVLSLVYKTLGISYRDYKNAHDKISKTKDN